MANMLNKIMLTIGLGAAALGARDIGKFVSQTAMENIPKLVQSQTHEENERLLKSLVSQHEKYVTFLRSSQKNLYDLSVLLRSDHPADSSFMFQISEEYGNIADSLDSVFKLTTETKLFTPNDVRQMLAKYMQVRKDAQMQLNQGIVTITARLDESFGSHVPKNVQMSIDSLKELVKTHQ